MSNEKKGLWFHCLLDPRWVDNASAVNYNRIWFLYKTNQIFQNGQRNIFVFRACISHCTQSPHKPHVYTGCIRKGKTSAFLSSTQNCFYKRTSTYFPIRCRLGLFHPVFTRIPRREFWHMKVWYQSHVQNVRKFPPKYIYWTQHLLLFSSCDWFWDVSCPGCTGSVIRTEIV